ncbi:set1/Ash2 histone methyltransferase complex subunit ASH2-like isoform X2 [Homarus americanus]|uniref:set1/Ash2 histone methyltransferase complex subunit ASH2-like isoform X2 n=1 Tax=Homarus americanus TaxID=6706 RepID=UPI001C451411|nr:set1/Ash2 histone methyltransferase complex subunit ASH2-like isoform X2 [Homarus americanus]
MEQGSNRTSRMDYDSDENEVLESGVVDVGEKGGLSSCGYCGKLRNLNAVELMCWQCGSWFHESCISYQLGKLVPFMLNYSFTCKTCSSTGVETFRKTQAQLRDMCITALANLQHGNKDNRGNTMFSLQRDVIPFLEQNWEALTTAARRSTQSWHTTLQRMLMKEVDAYFTVEETGESGEPTQHHPFFGLLTSDLTLIRPIVDAPGGWRSPLSGSSQQQQSGKGRGAKRKMPETTAGNKKARGDMPAPKLHGYPVDHPFNKDGYRYILAEPDPHAPFRQEFDDSNDWAGKPIPGWLYRALSPGAVLLALHDRAPQLRTADDRLAVTGDKGYCLIRATHGVSRGVWYWECTIDEQPEGSHTRIGWCQQLANLQAPLGYDKFGYSWRSRKGTVFHESRGKHYFEGGFGEGDVLGIMIDLPEKNPVSQFPPTYKDKPLVKFRSHLYYEDKDDVPEALKNLKPLNGGKIIFFKNGKCCGEAFQNIYGGTYYPGVSLYRNITLSVNFGPDFKHPPASYEYRGMHERCEESMVERTLADMTYLVENEGKLRLDVFT